MEFFLRGPNRPRWTMNGIVEVRFMVVRSSFSPAVRFYEYARAFVPVKRHVCAEAFVPVKRHL